MYVDKSFASLISDSTDHITSTINEVIRINNSIDVTKRKICVQTIVCAHTGLQKQEKKHKKKYFCLAFGDANSSPIQTNTSMIANDRINIFKIGI